MHLEGNQQKAFSRAVRLFERGIVAGGDVEEALHLLRDATRSVAVAAAQGWDFAPWNANVGLPDSWLSWHAQYGHQDPSRAILTAAPAGQWFFIQDCTPAEKDLELFRGFAGHFGDGAIVRVQSPFSSELCLVFYRERRQRFADGEEDILRVLYPHIASGLGARSTLAALTGGPSTKLDDLLASSPGHATISYPELKVVWSKRARSFWKQRLSVDEVGWSRIDQMLIVAVKRFQCADVHGRSQMLVPGVHVDFVNVPPSAGESRRLLAVLVAKPLLSLSEPAPAEALLTNRQRAVARLLAAGLTLAQVARQLGIRLETARGYIKEIHRRLGVHSRAQLVAALSQREITPQDDGDL